MSMKLRDIILFGMMLTGFAGCADFLDVQPQAQAIGETIVCHEGRVLHGGERYIQ